MQASALLAVLPSTNCGQYKVGHFRIEALYVGVVSQISSGCTTSRVGRHLFTRSVLLFTH